MAKLRGDDLVFRKTGATQAGDADDIADLHARIALLEDQLMTAQAMLEAEAKARIALEARLAEGQGR